MNQDELHELVLEHVSDLMQYKEVEYGDTLNTLTMNFVLNVITEELSSKELSIWITQAVNYKTHDLAEMMRDEVKSTAYEIIYENLSALNVDSED